MGKKNKNKKSDEPEDSKSGTQQQVKPPNPETTKKEESGNKQKGVQPPQGQQQQKSQQGAWGGGQPKGQQNPQQGAWGGGQQQQLQGSWRGGPPKDGQIQQQRGDSQQQRKGAQPQAGPRQQSGDSWCEAGRQRVPNQQKDGLSQQRPNQSQQHSGGGQQQSGPKQQGGGDQRQGAWDQQQRSTRQGDAGQQRAPNQGSGGQQRGAWDQQQSGQRQQGEAGDQQQRSTRQQGDAGQQRAPGQGSGGQQRGAWDQQQSGPRQQGGGGDQRRGAGDQQQRSARQGDAGQQRAPNQGSGQQRDARYQQGGGQQQYGRGQQSQQGTWNQGQQARGQSQQQQQTGQLPQKMAELSISNEVPLPVKEKSCNGIVRGTLGRSGTVEVNYVRLNLDKMPNEAYHYDVTITPDKPKKFLRPAFEQFRLEMFPDTLLAFDGFKNAYSMERLKAPVERKVEVPDSSSRMKEFNIQLQETDNCVVDLKTLRTYQNERVFDKPMRALQVLEVVLASNNHERGVRVGRSFFRRPNDAFNLDDGYEAWTGLYQAAILGEAPLLNVDIAHKSFPRESTLINYLDEMGVDKNRDLSSDYKYRDICSFLKGMNIVYTPPESFGASPKQYKVLNIEEPASAKYFKTEDGKQHTVENYFRSRGYTLKYPHLNCLSVGSTIKQISLPMELCSIPKGQAMNRKDNSRQVEKMIRYAATSTNRRKQKIMELLSYFEHNVNRIIRGFGLTIGAHFIKVPMRMLPSPYMEYLQGQTVTTVRGAWRMDDKKFLVCSKPPNGHKWAILYEESTGRRGISYHDLEGFKTAVAKTSQTLNMNLQSNAEIKTYNFRQLQAVLRQLVTEKYDLVFVVLSERGTPYSKIKQTAELEVGLLTQCIKDKTIFRTIKDRTVFSNILLKVNGKLNGTNHKIAQDRDSHLLSSVKNVMYLGADVTHPSPDQRHIPSVVGVAASHDPNGACYNCQYRLQRSTVENIEDMESIVRRHLEVYHKYQKCYPGQIIYYRDGVSDGQFPIVEREEIRAIKRACKKMGCDPKLTCVIVVKRHHTRFFPLTQPQHERDFNNVQAGTVVDQYITHPNEVQFFMVSHQSIQGTARPTRYNVIMDESKFDINLLQKLTYNLCHLFPRCNRAVSYPAPAYLAHLVAFRGRVYLEGTQKFGNLQTEYERRQIKLDFLNRNPMYFI